MDIDNKTLLVFLVAAVVISLAGTIVSLNKLGRLSTVTTGYASGTGTASINVSTTTSVRFAISTIDFGTGGVNTTGGYNNCTMTINDSSAITRVGCSGFNSVNTAGDTFVIENDGNTDVNLTFNCSTNESAFIGGTASIRSFQYAVSNNESSSCKGTLSATGWTNVPITNPNICTNLTYVDTTDTIRVGIRIVVPYDSIQGERSATFTATGDALS
jgi:hypothetical protein